MPFSQQITKRLHPDFFMKGRKPTGQFEIDEYHPLAKYLVQAIVWDYNTRELRKWNALSIAGSTLTSIVGAGGRGIYSDPISSSDAGNILIEITNNPKIDLTKEVSHFVLGSWPSAQTDTAWTKFATKGYDVSWALHAQWSNTQKPAMRIWSGGAEANAQATTNIFDGSLRSVCGGYDGSNVYIAVDGTIEATTAKTGNIDSTSLPLWLNSDGHLSTVAECPTGNFYVQYTFSKGLSADEIFSLDKDPYQLLRPANNFFWVPAQATGTTPVSADRDLRWNLQALLSKDNDLRWGLEQQVFKDNVIQWSLEVQALKDTTAKWNLLNSISVDLDARWNLNGLVSSDTDLRWHLEGTVFSDSTLAWSLLNKIQSDSTQQWSIITGVTKDIDSRWDIEALTSADLSAMWNLQSQVIKDETIIWSLLSQVNNDDTFKWALLSSLFKDSDIRWDILQGLVNQDLTLQWSLDSITGAPVRRVLSGKIRRRVQAGVKL